MDAIIIYIVLFIQFINLWNSYEIIWVLDI